jgi:LacI family transcriptional regulator
MRNGNLSKVSTSYTVAIESAIKCAAFGRGKCRHEGTIESGGGFMNLKEFAAKMGLSQTTISRALSGYPEVKQETRERIEAAALKYGYHPNRAAIGLATGRAGAIGIVLKANSEFGPHMSEFLGGLGSSLDDQGIDILVSTVESSEAEIAAYRRLAASKRIDAVVLHTPTERDGRIEILTGLGLPFVLHGRTQTDTPYNFMDIDNYDAIFKASEHLIELGHKRIALINGFPGRTFADHRDQGFRAAHEKHGLDVDEVLLGSGEFTDEMGFRLTSNFLNSATPPTAVIAGSMMSALGAIRAIRFAGLQLGSDISLIAHDDVFPYISPDNMVPKISTTQSSMRAAGARVGEMLLQLISGKRVETFHDIWPVDLVIRESTCPPLTAR